MIECLKGTGGDVFSVQHANEPRIIHVVSPHIEIINVYLARTEAEASKVIGEEATGRARAHMRAGRRIAIFHDDPHSDWARKVKPCVRLHALGDYASLPNY